MDVFRPQRRFDPRAVPQVDVEIDWNHPLADALAGAWVLGRSWADLVSGTPASIYNSAPKASAGPIGPAYTSTASTNSLKLRPTGLLGGSANFTIVAAGDQLVNFGLLYCERAPSGNDIIKLGVGNSNSGNNKVSCVYRDDQGNLVNGITVSGTDTPVDGAYHTLAFWKSGSNFAQYFDGLVDGTNTLTTTNTFTDANITTIGADPADASMTWGGRQVYAYAYKRALSASELLWIHQEPFAMLRPRARRLYSFQPSVGAGSITGTLSATQTNESLSASAAVNPIAAQLSQTQANATLAAAAVVRVAGALSLTQANEALVGVAINNPAGQLSVTQANEALSSTVSVVVTGGLSEPQASETLSGTIGSGAFAQLSITQANEVLSASAWAAVSSALLMAQANQPLAALAQTMVSGHLSETQIDESVSAFALVTASGALTRGQASNILAGFTSIIVSSALAEAGENELLSASGFVASQAPVYGGLSALQLTQTLDAVATSGVIDQIFSAQQGTIFVRGFSVRLLADSTPGYTEQGYEEEMP